MNSRYTAPNTQGILWIVVEDNIDDLTPNQLGEVSEISAHHATLVHGKTLAELPPQLQDMVNQPFPLHITGSAVNAQLGLQAYVVDLPEELKQLSGKTHPHITHFQAIRDNKAVSSRFSNDMLAAADYTFTPLNHTVNATVRFCSLEHTSEQELSDREALMVKRLTQALSEITQAEEAGLAR